MLLHEGKYEGRVVLLRNSSRLQCWCFQWYFYPESSREAPPAWLTALMWSHMCKCVYVCGICVSEQICAKGGYQVPCLITLHLTSLRWGSLHEPGVLLMHLSLYSIALVLQVKAYLVFSTGIGNLNSGLHACGENVRICWAISPEFCWFYFLWTSIQKYKVTSNAKFFLAETNWASEP